uniref:Protein kinase domain-containing protein n=1 Tax=Manihot esculenta TaxID=3983 RepID=A0A2C9W0Y9_MANES
MNTETMSISVYLNSTIGEIVIFVFLLISQTCKGGDSNQCPPSSCGKNHNISYPFRLQTDPINCGDLRYELSCEKNLTVLNFNGGRYYVQSINYDNFTIRLVDAGVHPDNCSSIPRFPLITFEMFDTYSTYRYQWSETDERKWAKLRQPPELSQMIMFIKCQNPVKSPVYVETAPCLISSYVNIGDMKANDLMELCGVEMISLFPLFPAKKNMSFLEIHRQLAFGFQLSWHNIHCGQCDGGCYLDSREGIRCLYNDYWSFCGAPCVIAFLIYKWRRRHLSGYETIEEFLQSHNNLMPIRYSYSDIRKITRGFKEKLGEGGFGFVYKGKLRSGKFAAIKMLGKSKANGQDFINEVATIGRIHHTNIVKLIGFCVEGTKHALVYEFMSNGSLDNYIFCQEGSISLSWEKLYEISFGVARGIEYLHQGCNMQILHFDIKPHNILLDENFTPKISDFGLAKLYPTKGSIASLTAARGTIGYMAPELFYKNIGRVSYKADVYSFGMLLLEIAGKRKNLNALAENLSQVYYPFWVYDQLSSGKLTIEDSSEEENILARKMIITGLWCIQMQPCNRPPMNKVLDMLEGDLKSLELPPRPVLYPVESMTMDEGESSSISSEVK